MASRRAQAALRSTLLIAAGAGAMLAWREGFYANAALALLIGVWMTAIGAAIAGRNDAAPPMAAPAILPNEEEQRAQKRLLAYLNLSPAPLVMLDRQGRLWAINRAARRMFGADDLIAAAPADLVAAINATAPGTTANITLESGGAAHASALMTADLNIGAGAGVGDAGDRIAALIDIDAALKAAEARALRDLLDVLSHEIMNALTPIASLGRTAAELLADHDPDLAAVRDAVDTVARRTEGLQRFSSAYRHLARLPAAAPARMDTRIFADDLQRLFATRWGEGAALSVRLERAPRIFRADADQLTAAIWALLQNAVEAAGGNHAEVELTIRGSGQGVSIAVADGGPGLAPGEEDMIFRPFYTTKPKGSGVGLALARQIARAHGGELRLKQPAPSGGAVFELTLPPA